MRAPALLLNVLLGTSALVFAGARLAPAKDTNGPVLTAAVALVTKAPVTRSDSSSSPITVVAAEANNALLDIEQMSLGSTFFILIFLLAGCQAASFSILGLWQAYKDEIQYC